MDCNHILNIQNEKLFPISKTKNSTEIRKNIMKSEYSRESFKKPQIMFPKNNQFQQKKPTKYRK